MPETESQSRNVTAGSDDIVVSWAAVTDTGRRRESNQDAFLTQFPLFVVADGMGGHAGGEIAARSTVTRLLAVANAGEVSTSTIEAALELAIADIADHPETTDEGTGTTLTGVYLDLDAEEPRWISLNIGDSRVYLLRDDRLVQVTTDHSVVQELIAAGKISPEEAEAHPYSNVITRAVGTSELIPPDYLGVDVVDGDRFVICSDGLTKELTDYGIQHFLREHADPAEAAEAMLAAALENGGRDNVTLVVIAVSRVSADAKTAEVDSAVETADAPVEDSSSTSDEIEHS